MEQQMSKWGMGHRIADAGNDYNGEEVKLKTQNDPIYSLFLSRGLCVDK